MPAEGTLVEIPVAEVAQAPTAPGSPAPNESGTPHALSGSWEEGGRTVRVLALGNRAIVNFHDAFDDSPSSLQNCACEWWGAAKIDELVVSNPDGGPTITATRHENTLALHATSGLRCCQEGANVSFAPRPRPTGNQTPPERCVTKAELSVFTLEGEIAVPAGTTIWHLRDSESGAYVAGMVRSAAVVGSASIPQCR